MIIQSVINPVILILSFQFLINIGFAYLTKQDSIRRYKIISCVVSIGFAVSLPVIQILRLIILMKNIGAPDALGLSMGLETILFWIVNIIGVTGIQLFFNQYLLTRIVTRKQER